MRKIKQMKLEFNPRNEDEVRKAAAKIEKALYKIKVSKAAKILLNTLNIRGVDKLSTNYGIKTLADVTKFTQIEFKKLKGIGPKLSTSINDSMHKEGLVFKTPVKESTKKATRKNIILNSKISITKTKVPMAKVA